MNDKTIHVSFGDLLTMVSLAVGEIKVGVGITVDVEEGEGELGAMDLTTPYDGPSILGGLVVLRMKVLLKVHGDLISLSNSLFSFFRISYLIGTLPVFQLASFFLL